MQATVSACAQTACIDRVDDAESRQPPLCAHKCRAGPRERAIFQSFPPRNPLSPLPSPPPRGGEGRWVWVGGWVYVVSACVLDTGLAGAKGLLRLA